MIWPRGNSTAHPRRPATEYRAPDATDAGCGL